MTWAIVPESRVGARLFFFYWSYKNKLVEIVSEKGWWQRTVALRYLRANTSEVLGSHREGVLYFADDDNSYDVTLFTNYIRNVKKLGMWAVGMLKNFLL